MSDEIIEHILEVKQTTARLEEKVNNIETYIIRDFKSQLTKTTALVESRFRWTVGMFVTFVSVSIGLTLTLWRGI